MKIDNVISAENDGIRRREYEKPFLKKKIRRRMAMC
jgi:hypothetical protein